MGGKDPSIKYFRFDIYQFMSKLDLRTHVGVLEFFTPVFDWIDNAVASGHNVLVHCLAGAHRAGTTGVAYCLYGSNLDYKTAIAACKACRPIVDPMGDLTDLLRVLEVAIAKARETGRSSSRQIEPPKTAKSVQVWVQNVTGEKIYPLDCDLGWLTKQLQEAVMSTAPADFVDQGGDSCLMFNGDRLDCTSEVTLA